MRTGVRFFADDEDEFGLEDLLQACTGMMVQKKLRSS